SWFWSGGTGTGAEFLQGLPEFRMGSRIGREVDALDRRLPCLSDGANASGRPAGVADYAAAAQIHQVEGAASARVGFGRLAAPLPGAHDRQRAVAGLEDRRRDGLEGGDERVVRLPVFRTDPVDLELVDAEQAPELLPDLEVHAEAGVAGEDIPAVPVSVDDKVRAFSQEGETTHANGVDIDDGRVSPRIHDDIVVAHHFGGIGMRDAEGVHRLPAGLLLAVENERH